MRRDQHAFSVIHLRTKPSIIERIILKARSDNDNKESFLASRLSVLSGAAIVIPLFSGCGSSTQNTSNLPPVDDSNRQPASTAQVNPARKGMSNGQKIVMLAGAAALYYMYKKNQESHQAGNTAEPQYYLSKNGRVYYREKGGRVHWVTPPTEGIQIPQSEASQYEQLQGYGGRTTGRDLTGMGDE